MAAYIRNGHRIEEVRLHVTGDDDERLDARVDGQWQDATGDYFYNIDKPGRRVWRFDAAPEAERMQEALRALREAGLPLKGLRLCERWTRVGGIRVRGFYVYADGFPPERT